MKTRIANIWETLHDSYWFIPLLMVVCAILTALLLLAIDQRLEIKVIKIGNISFVYSGGIEAALDLLSAIAGSIIAIASVSFSITIVALSLAAAEYGPRLLRHYTRNTGNQIVLGTFVSTFTYCTVVYSQIPDKSIWDNPPRIAVSFAIVLAVACIGVFIYFIHHMAEYIRADIIISAAFHELLYRIEHIYPEKLGLDVREVTQTAQTHHLPADFDSNCRIIMSPVFGYLQAIETENLVMLAHKNDLLIKMACRPGDFLISNRPTALVYPSARIDSELEKSIIATFIVGPQRTPEQDVEFAIHELVEIALRALSPSLNDPFTAMSCIDRLTAGLCRLSERRFPSEERFDAEHKLRIVAEVTSFDSLVYAAIDPIRRNAVKNEIVKQYLIKNLHKAIDHARADRQQKPLKAQLEMIVES